MLWKLLTPTFHALLKDLPGYGLRQNKAATMVRGTAVGGAEVTVCALASTDAYNALGFHGWILTAPHLLRPPLPFFLLFPDRLWLPLDCDCCCRCNWGSVGAVG